MSLSAPDRFAKKYTVTQDGCWVWIGSKNNMGYGQFRFNGKTELAHRVSYELANGPIVVGLNVLHKCDTPACVNPDHLEAGTQKKNIQDAHDRGLCNPYKKVSDEDIELIRLAYETLPIQQKDICKAWGISPATVSRYVNYQERA